MKINTRLMVNKISTIPDLIEPKLPDFACNSQSWFKYYATGFCYIGLQPCPPINRNQSESMKTARKLKKENSVIQSWFS